VSDSMIPALVKGGTDQASTDIRTVESRVPGAGEVRLRVEACGLCGSDVHAWRGDPGYEWVRTPVVMGHEMVGVVDGIGDGVDPAWSGKRVVPMGIDGCHRCATCAAGRSQICPEREVMGLSFDGGLAASVTVPAARLVKVDAHAPALRMTLTEPMSVASRAVRRLGGVAPGTRVVVSGPGPIGLFAAWLLARRGVDVVLTGTESDETIRLPAARRLGLKTMRAEKAEFDGPVGAWIEASGSVPGFRQAVGTVTPGGRVVVVALFARDPQLEINTMVRGEIDVIGSYASLREDYVLAAAELAAADGLEEVVSTAFPLTEALTALEATSSGLVVKAVLEP
jgi:L-iditol 2-dehydrogenase